MRRLICAYVVHMILKTFSTNLIKEQRVWLSLLVVGNQNGARRRTVFDWLLSVTCDLDRRGLRLGSFEFGPGSERKSSSTRSLVNLIYKKERLWNVEKLDPLEYILWRTQKQTWFFFPLSFYIFEPRHDKTCLCYMRTTKGQIILRIRTVWPAPLLFAA